MPCSIEGCERKYYASGLCQRHYNWRYKYGSVAPPVRKKTQYDWIVSHAKYDSDECLIWPFARKSGYGTVKAKGRSTGAHRMMCELANGSAPTTSHQAAHNCGNGVLGCVNPNHLSWKTPKENSGDRAQHGTLNAGEKNGGAKLKASDVPVILGLCEQGIPRSVIATEYRVSRASIDNIVNGKTWLSETYGYQPRERNAA